MDELREMRVEELKRYYDILAGTSDPEEVEVLMKKIRVLEEAVKSDLEVDTKLYEIDKNLENDDINREQEKAENKKNRIVEGFKIAGTVVGSVIGTLTSVKVAAWIIEVEKTGTIRSKAFDLVRKGMK